MKPLIARIVVCLSYIFLCAACLNSIDDETPVAGNIPITFSAQIGGSSTRLSESAFEVGDQVGVYALLSGKTIEQERYIDNLCLTAQKENALVPEATVFYPEGGATLDFISYYPYRSAGVGEGNSLLTVSVQTDQSKKTAFDASDFLLARTENVAGSTKAVSLSYSHEFTKLCITLVPESAEDAAALLEANPRIVLNNCCTEARYDLAKETDNLSLLSGSVADVVAGGTWAEQNGELTGKEIIIVPQVIDNSREILVELSGKVYTCPLPALQTDATGKAVATEGGKQYEVRVSIAPAADSTFKGVKGSIRKWEDSQASVDVQSSLTCFTLHLSALSFRHSNIYRVYRDGEPIAEIAKEYLRSEGLTSVAIVAYPMNKGQADLSKGTVLQLADVDTPLCGGRLVWDTAANGCVYTPGSSTNIGKVSFNASGELCIGTCEVPIAVSVSAYVLRDVRGSASREYPLVKVGAQYWMRENLAATSYRDGTALTRQTNLGNGKPGYFYAQSYDFYFYNGEALSAGELAPEGWRIPTSADWDVLKGYAPQASLLKTGTWKAVDTSAEPTAALNSTMLAVLPVGVWNSSTDKHYNYEKVTAFWTWDEGIPASTVAFTGDSDDYLQISTRPEGETYRALSIRCVRK